MNKLKFVTAVFFALSFVGICNSPVKSQTPKFEKPMGDCPMMNGGEDMKSRGDHAMGFSQDKTTHHFLITETGGIIQVKANDLSDNAGRNQVREHLRHITMMFSSGDFGIPLLVHDQAPPGTAEMKQLRGVLTYSYEDTADGGRVLINAGSPPALAAVHKFLAFQIQEHKTGDPIGIH